MIRTSCMMALMMAVLCGCVQVDNTPTDLSYLSVSVVDKQSRPELAERLWQRSLLKVSFSSSVNLNMFANEHYANIGISAFFCNNPDQYARIAWPDVYSDGRQIGIRNSDLDSTINLHDTKIYYVYMFVAGEAEDGGYDLKVHSKDVCFYISGGNGIDWAYKSNTILVPEEDMDVSIKEEISE